jgi:hypothetical protein
MNLRGGYDKAGKSAHNLSKAFPFAIPALNIRVSPITIHATSANGMFLEVEDIGIWHPLQNLTHCANRSTGRADQGFVSFSSLRGHNLRVGQGPDKNVIGF